MKAIIPYLFVVLVQAQIEELDYQFFQNIQKNPNSMGAKPYIIMFYYRFGAVYTRLKQEWEKMPSQYAEYTFGQVEIFHDESRSLFEIKKIPTLILIQDNIYYRNEKVLEIEDIQVFIDGWTAFPYYPLPKRNFIDSTLDYFNRFPNKEILQGSKVFLFILLIIYIRLKLYKDNKNDKIENQQLEKMVPTEIIEESNELNLKNYELSQ